MNRCILGILLIAVCVQYANSVDTWGATVNEIYATGGAATVTAEANNLVDGATGIGALDVTATGEAAGADNSELGLQAIGSHGMDDGSEYAGGAYGKGTATGDSTSLTGETLTTIDDNTKTGTNANIDAGTEGAGTQSLNVELLNTQTKDDPSLYPTDYRMFDVKTLAKGDGSTSGVLTTTTGETGAQSVGNGAAAATGPGMSESNTQMNLQAIDKNMGDVRRLMATALGSAQGDNTETSASNYIEDQEELDAIIKQIAYSDSFATANGADSSKIIASSAVDNGTHSAIGNGDAQSTGATTNVEGESMTQLDMDTGGVSGNNKQQANAEGDDINAVTTTNIIGKDDRGTLVGVGAGSMTVTGNVPGTAEVGSSTVLTADDITAMGQSVGMGKATDGETELQLANVAAVETGTEFNNVTIAGASRAFGQEAQLDADSVVNAADGKWAGTVQLKGDATDEGNQGYSEIDQEGSVMTGSVDGMDAVTGGTSGTSTGDMSAQNHNLMLGLENGSPAMGTNAMGTSATAGGTAKTTLSTVLTRNKTKK